MRATHLVSDTVTVTVDGRAHKISRTHQGTPFYKKIFIRKLMHPATSAAVI